MRITSVLAVLITSVLLQMVAAHYTSGGKPPIDLVLVGVVYASVFWGPVAGILGGSAGGLTQDLLSNGIVGVGGLSKTLVGFAAGLFAAQFVVVRPQARVLVVAVATIANRCLTMALYSLIDQHWPVFMWSRLFEETAINSLAALAAFQAAEILPGAISRGRQSRESSLKRRQW